MIDIAVKRWELTPFRGGAEGEGGRDERDTCRVPGRAWGLRVCSWFVAVHLPAIRRLIGVGSWPLFGGRKRRCVAISTGKWPRSGVGGRGGGSVVLFRSSRIRGDVKCHSVDSKCLSIVGVCIWMCVWNWICAYV